VLYIGIYYGSATQLPEYVCSVQFIEKWCSDLQESLKSELVHFVAELFPQSVAVNKILKKTHSH